MRFLKEGIYLNEYTLMLFQEETFEPTTKDPLEDNNNNDEEEDGLKLNFIPGICVKISWGGIIAC